ncbi:MAG: ABC transporter substrate-binding protein [Gammaproteobacteria bacterium]|nr:ABC transporter substrate-binding protein [Gammaproteobacteria bacterium]
MHSEDCLKLKEGQLDAATLTLDEVLSARAQGLQLTLVTVMNISAGADVVLSKPEIKTPQDLRGKRIGIYPSTPALLLLEALLQQGGLEQGDVELETMAVQQQPEQWRQGGLDAVISYEPTASALRRLGAGRLFDSRQAPEMIFDVLAVRSERVADLAPSLRALLKAHYRSLEHIRSNRQDAIHRIATYLQLSPVEVETALGGIILPNLNSNRAQLAADGPLCRAAERVQQLLLKTGQFSQAMDLEGLTSPAYLPSDGE